MTSLDAILKTQKTLETSFSKRFEELDAALRAAAPSPVAHTTISSLSKEVASFKVHVNTMMQLLRLQIEAITNSVDSIEMRHRRKYLLFGGVAEAENENISEAIVSVCQQNMSLQAVTCSSMPVCHRIGSRTDRPRLVLVRFSDYQLRNAVWAKKTALKGTSVVLSEFLTKQRQSLFLAARRHFGVRKVWSLDGNIYVKLSSGKKERVTTSVQLQALITEHPSVQPSVNSSAPAPALAPLPSLDAAGGLVSVPVPSPVSQVPSRDPTNKQAEDRRGKRAQQ